MFCENCGSEIKDGSKFCGRCGAPVNIRNAAAAQPPVMPAPKPYSPDVEENNRTESNFNGGTGGGYSPAGRLQSLIAGMASSGLFMVTVILFTAALVIQLVSAIGSAAFGGNALMSVIDGIISQTGYSLNDIGGIGTVNAAINAVSAGTIITTIIAMVPGILTVIGLWLIFASAKSSQGTEVKPAGFTIIKVITLIYFWIMIVVGALAIIILIFGALFTADYADAAVISIFIVFIVLIAAIVALVCLYYSKIAKMLTSAREAGQGATNRLMISTYVQVITWILAIVMVLALIGSISSAGLLSAVVSSALPREVSAVISTGIVSPLPFLQYGCTAVSMILFAVIIGKAKALEY